jgi:hypothetical protein
MHADFFFICGYLRESAAEFFQFVKLPLDFALRGRFIVAGMEEFERWLVC